MAPPERFPLTFSFPLSMIKKNLFPALFFSPSLRRLLSLNFFSVFSNAPTFHLYFAIDAHWYFEGHGSLRNALFSTFFPKSPPLTMRFASHFFFGLHFTLFPQKKSNLPRECTRARHFFYLLNVTCLPDEK